MVVTAESAIGIAVEPAESRWVARRFGCPQFEQRLRQIPDGRETSAQRESDVYPMCTRGRFAIIG
jgi:hypothetical protein